MINSSKRPDWLDKLPSLFDCDTLCKVSGAINVAAAKDGEVVGEKLHGDDGEDALQAVHRLGHLQSVLSPLSGLTIPFLHHQDGLALTCRHLRKQLSSHSFIMLCLLPVVERSCTC